MGQNHADEKRRRSRRWLLGATLELAVSVTAAGCSLSTRPASTPAAVLTPFPSPTFIPSTRFTDWGWPLPYEQIATRSIDWLQQRDWWPLGFGYQPLWSGMNAVVQMMTTHRLSEVRGLRTAILPFLSEAAQEQAFAAGRIQVGSAAAPSLGRLIDRGAPVVSIAVQTPNLKVGTVVRNESRLRSIADLRGSGAIIGLTIDSIAGAYLISVGATEGLTLNRDVFLREMDVLEQTALPRTVSAVAPWDPMLSLIVAQNRNGRLIDVVFPHVFVSGNLVVRRELVENVPDVVQALVDTYQEAILYVRLRPGEAAMALRSIPQLAQLSLPLRLQQTIAYNGLYAPTFTYPFGDFWPTENASLSALLARVGLLTRPLNVEDWRSILVSEFIEHTFARLGWRIPERPPWIPPGWTGVVGSPPYPPYENVDTLQSPQVWPTPADLVRPWHFAGTTYYP